MVNGSYAMDVGKNGFHVLLSTQVEGRICRGDCKLDIKTLDCVFIPADAHDVKVEGNLEFLKICC